jgi:hypothetical protein
MKTPTVGILAAGHPAIHAFLYQDADVRHQTHDKPWGRIAAYWQRLHNKNV